MKYSGESADTQMTGAFESKRITLSQPAMNMSFLLQQIFSIVVALASLFLHLCPGVPQTRHRRRLFLSSPPLPSLSSVSSWAFASQLYLGYNAISPAVMGNIALHNSLITHLQN